MKLHLLTILFFSCITVVAQELSIKNFYEATNDLSARTKPRQDNNGADCALVKVQLAAPNATFTGNVMGDVAFKDNEYWVYMTAGSKRLKVAQPSYLPLEVSFADYGISRLAGKGTYILTLLLGDLPQGVQQQKIQTGWILLDSEPQGASVYINDEFVGNTPLDGYKQPYGTYSYRIERPNYHSSSGAIELNTGRWEKKITLQPAFGAISVKCNIAGATVLLDGKATGQNAPCTLQEVVSGHHTITLQLEKYAPRQENVVVEDGKTATLDISLDARFATIAITSLEGAQIFCNGKQVGTTKINEDMMEGYYDIEVKLNHHKAVTKQIQVTAGQSQQITLNPIPIYGSLDITSTPRDADITIDGKLFGKTPITVEQLLEGEHTVIISKDGYSSFKKVVNISDGTSETLSATMQEADEPVYDGHEYVDLGLPSGTKWATCNVGASKPEEYGDYFAWGETTKKSDYSWSTYKHCKGSSRTMTTKYCTDSEYGYNGFTDGKTELQPEDDAATANWGSEWQMPSLDQIKELCNSNYTTMTWTMQNGVSGRLITSKVNGNSIFLPAAGYRDDTSLNNAGSNGYYWSRLLDTSTPYYAYNLYFYSGYVFWDDGSRLYGRCVRPVRVQE